MIELLRVAPPANHSRWSLRLLQACVAKLSDYCLSGIWRILRRLKLVSKRGTVHLHSPDVQYLAKRERVLSLLSLARRDTENTVLLYLDEMSYYRQPTINRAWTTEGTDSAVRAPLSHRSNTRRRIVAALNAVTGEVLFATATKIGIKALQRFYREIRRRYPAAQRIYVVQDNWNVHFHEQVLAQAQAARIGIILLPTYAPWLNPIEKLWRYLRQTVLHLHRQSDQWKQLQERVEQFLRQFADSSPELLQYCGLLSD